MTRRADIIVPLRGPRAKRGERNWRRVLEMILRQRRHLLRAPVARAGGPDPTDAAQEREEELVWLAVLDLARDIRAQADEALVRLLAGGYGRCATCAKPIPPARLQALPFAVRCLPCQERSETRARAGARLAGHGARTQFVATSGVGDRRR